MKSQLFFNPHKDMRAFNNLGHQITPRYMHKLYTSTLIMDQTDCSFVGDDLHLVTCMGQGPRLTATLDMNYCG